MHNINNALYVKLTASDNEYFTYPAYGMIELIELGTTGSIITATFMQAKDGKLVGAPVVVRNPKFEYSPRLAKIGHSAISDLIARRREGDESANYRHKIIELASGDVLEVCGSRLEADLFCKNQHLRVEHNMIYPDKGVVYAHVYPTIGTKTLAAIYSILCNDDASSDAELIAHFQTFGLTLSQAGAQVARRNAARKAPL